MCVLHMRWTHSIHRELVIGMNDKQIPRITFNGADKSQWIKTQLTFRPNKVKENSSFVGVEGIHQCRRDRERDLLRCRIKPQPNAFMQLGTIEY